MPPRVQIRLSQPRGGRGWGALDHTVALHEGFDAGGDGVGRESSTIRVATKQFTTFANGQTKERGDGTPSFVFPVVQRCAPRPMNVGHGESRIRPLECVPANGTSQRLASTQLRPHPCAKPFAFVRGERALHGGTFKQASGVHVHPSLRRRGRLGAGSGDTLAATTYVVGQLQVDRPANCLGLAHAEVFKILRRVRNERTPLDCSGLRASWMFSVGFSFSIQNFSRLSRYFVLHVSITSKTIACGNRSKTARTRMWVPPLFRFFACPLTRLNRFFDDPM
jgi:hypothetical protein